MKHYKNPKLAHFKALQMYLNLVGEIPDVVEVRLSEHDELHTIISAPVFDDDSRHPVFAAQVKVMREIEPQPFLFLLLNCEELGTECREEQIKRIGELVWKR